MNLHNARKLTAGILLAGILAIGIAIPVLILVCTIRSFIGGGL